jgi:hypothetical protein
MISPRIQAPRTNGIFIRSKVDFPRRSATRAPLRAGALYNNVVNGAKQFRVAFQPQALGLFQVNGSLTLCSG